MGTLGILDFLSHYDEREANYVFSLCAVKAPFTEMTQEFFSFHNEKTWKKNVPKHSMTEEDMVRDYSYALVEVLDSEWSIIIDSVFFADGHVKGEHPTLEKTSILRLDQKIKVLPDPHEYTFLEFN
jgi:hypothetical protein